MVVSMERWIGKVAVVTGASSGIGAALAKRLVEEGMVVAGLARRVERMEEAATELSNKRGSFHPIKCDLADEENILEAIQFIKDTLGPIHVLVNNAGMAKIPNSLCCGDTEPWRQILAVNVLALCICTREAIKDMTENNVDGHIIHVNSVTGQFVPKENMPMNMYPPSKFAVRALAEGLRQEFNHLKSNIKITNLSPGIVMTDIFEASGKPINKTEENSFPYLDVEDIADSVVYILSTPPNVMIIPQCMELQIMKFTKGRPLVKGVTVINTLSFGKNHRMARSKIQKIEKNLNTS